MTLAELLKRHNNGLRKGAQIKLSRAMGVTQATVSRWVSGELVPGEDQRLPLAKELGISVEELVFALDATRASYRIRASADGGRVASRAAALLPVIGIATDDYFKCDLGAYPDEALPIVSCGSPSLFALRISGTVLEPLAISGDYAVLSEQSYAASSQIVLAKMSDGCLLRRYFMNGRTAVLRPERRSAPDRTVSNKEIAILGVVKYFVRKP